MGTCCVSGNNQENLENKKGVIQNNSGYISRFDAKIRSISGKFTDPYDVDTEEEVMNSLKRKQALTLKRLQSACTKTYKEEDEVDDLTTSNATTQQLSKSDTGITLDKSEKKRKRLKKLKLEKRRTMDEEMTKEILSSEKLKGNALNRCKTDKPEKENKASDDEVNNSGESPCDFTMKNIRKELENSPMSSVLIPINDEGEKA